MHIETFIRKSFNLKAHMFVKVEEREPTEVLVDRFCLRRPQYRTCGLEAGGPTAAHRTQRPWRDLEIHEHRVELVYPPPCLMSPGAACG